jgi:hypothetical protein
LAYAFLEAYPRAGFAPAWIKPLDGHIGNHIVVAKGNVAFDYHGYSDWPMLFAHTCRKAGRWWPGWHADVIALAPDVLVSEEKSRRYEGLRLREPRQFLHDALPRAHEFLRRYPPPA